MPIYNPHEWTESYVRNNERECVDILERLNGAMLDSIHQRDYKSAGLCCDGICDGVSLLAKRDPNQYAPMLYGYSFILAEILLFGIGGSGGLRAAIPPLQDALDFAKDCARPGRRTADRAKRDADKIENMLKDLSRGASVDSVRRTYCADFPHDILGD
jgi:hypothetical protein